MKKLLIGILLSLFLCGTAYSAGSAISVSSDTLIKNASTGEVELRVITIIFTADDTDGSIPSLTLNESTTGLMAYGKSLIGWYAYKLEIDCNHAGTEPTEDSEIYIYQNSVDLLDGNGVDQIDNSAERAAYFQSDGYPMPQPIIGTLTITITQQAAATNDATGTVYLILKKSN